MNDDSTHGIVWRMEDCLQRMLQHFQVLSASHAALLQALDAEKDSAEEILSGAEPPPFDMKTLGEEYWILKREWDNAPEIGQPDRIRMRLLGEKVEEISHALQDSCEQIATHAQSEAQDFQSELDKLKRMGSNVQKYRPGGDEDRRGFDSQA